MKKLLLTFLVALPLAGFAQIGIGTTSPDASSALDVSAANKGFLPPRVSLTGQGDNTTISNPAAGLLVYNTNASATNLPAGLCYFDGSSWQRMATVATGGPVLGDVKSGLQASDHQGWIKLDGRAKNTLTASQQTAANDLGIGASLPNAANSFLTQNGATLGSVSGTNDKIIGQANLPNVTLTGTTNVTGNHTHTSAYRDPAVNNGPYNGVGPGSFFNYASTTTSTNGNHSHTIATTSINGNVTQTAFSVIPQSVSVNMFVYLGN